MPSENLLEDEDLNIIKDIKSSLSEKIANPFIASFITSWVVSNSSLVYSFFYFDKNLSLEKRLAYFNHYWKENSFVASLLWASVHALVIILCLYLFSSIARLISYIFYNKIVPYLKKITGKTIITKEEYDYLQLKLINKEKEVDDLVVRASKTQDANASLKKTLLEKSVENKNAIDSLKEMYDQKDKEFNDKNIENKKFEKEVHLLAAVWDILYATNKLDNNELTFYLDNITAMKNDKSLNDFKNSEYFNILNEINPSSFILSPIILSRETETDLFETEFFKKELNSLLEHKIIRISTIEQAGHTYFHASSNKWHEAIVKYEYLRRIKLAKDLNL